MELMLVIIVLFVCFFILVGIFSQGNVKVKRLHHGAVIPQYATSGSAGFDFVSPVDGVIPPGGRLLIKTGLSMEIPRGYEVQIRPRSGLALKHGITVANSPGTIDSDYTGEIGIILINFGTQEFHFKAGDRIAQGVLAEFYDADFKEEDSLQETERGSGGFGSTDTKGNS